MTRSIYNISGYLIDDGIISGNQLARGGPVFRPCTKRTLMLTAPSLVHSCLLGVLFVWSGALGAAESDAAHIRIVVEPSGGRAARSRAAHFHWQVRSQSGAQPRVGQFACGSPWVSPAAGERGVRLVALHGSGNPDETDLLSLDCDPLPHAHGLVGHGKTYGSYDAAQDDLPKLPLLYTPPEGSYLSLVAAMQRNEQETSSGGTKAIVGGVVDAYCILTVLAEAPAEDGANTLRPSFLGDRKEILTWDDIDLDLVPAHDFLPRVESFAASAVRWNHSTEVFSMATWNGTTFRSHSEGGRAFRPHLLHHDYASGRGAAINDAMVSLMSAHNTIDEKKPLLAALISQGLDIWNQVYGRAEFPGRWSSGAGQWKGQFMPAVFATALLKDRSKARALMRIAADPHSRDSARMGPQELRQIRRGVTGVLLWGDGHNPHREVGCAFNQQDLRYWADLKGGASYTGVLKRGSPNVGQKTAADPYGYIDGPPGTPGTSYMAVSLGGMRSFAAIMLLFPRAREIVNSDDVIEYVDRVDRVGRWAAPDPIAAIPAEDQTSSCDPWRGGKGCSGFTTTWGPHPADARHAIENGVGRFTALHAKSLRPGYTAGRVEAHWAAIMALYDGDRFEDRFVDIDGVVAPDIVVSPEETDLVYLTSGSIDAQIHYTLDGTPPTAQSPQYREPFTIGAATEIRAIALKGDRAPSAVSIFHYDPRTFAAGNER